MIVLLRQFLRLHSSCEVFDIEISPTSFMCELSFLWSEGEEDEDEDRRWQEEQEEEEGGGLDINFPSPGISLSRATIAPHFSKCSHLISNWPFWALCSHLYWYWTFLLSLSTHWPLIFTLPQPLYLSLHFFKISQTSVNLSNVEPIVLLASSLSLCLVQDLDFSEDLSISLASVLKLQFFYKTASHSL